MTQFEILKLATDFGLLASLIYFTYRFSRGSSSVNPYHLQELHSGLKSAIKEADLAGKGLNDQLMQRKSTLEKLLFELESVESRINRAVNNAEQQKTDLEFEVSKAKHIRSELAQETAFMRPVARPVDAYDQPRVQSYAPEMNEPEAFAAAVNPAARTNIFGEPINEPAASPKPAKEIEKAFANTPLTGMIEKEVEIAPVQKTVVKTPELSLEEIYTHAEDLLRAGKAIEEVSRETNLTADEVRLLSQMVENDMQQAALESGNSDSRLGVLAGFKRQTQVL